MFFSLVGSTIWVASPPFSIRRFLSQWISFGSTTPLGFFSPPEAISAIFCKITGSFFNQRNTDPPSRAFPTSHRFFIPLDIYQFLDGGPKSPFPDR